MSIYIQVLNTRPVNFEELLNQTPVSPGSVFPEECVKTAEFEGRKWPLLTFNPRVRPFVKCTTKASFQHEES